MEQEQPASPFVLMPTPNPESVEIYKKAWEQTKIDTEPTITQKLEKVLTCPN
jgi:hypothetical protein